MAITKLFHLMSFFEDRKKSSLIQLLLNPRRKVLKDEKQIIFNKKLKNNNGCFIIHSYTSLYTHLIWCLLF